MSAQIVKNEAYVSLSTAMNLKKAGFNLPVRSYYQHGVFHEYTVDRERVVEHDCNAAPDYMEQYSAPTISMAIRWLREQHKIYIWVKPCTYGEPFGGTTEPSGIHEEEDGVVLWTAKCWCNEGGHFITEAWSYEDVNDDAVYGACDFLY
jgi:hypothetical protein